MGRSRAIGASLQLIELWWPDIRFVKRFSVGGVSEGVRRMLTRI
jgi:hypothetical protein